MRSPVPTTSCQRARTSPRSSAPLRTASSTSSSAPRRRGRRPRAARRRRPPARRARARHLGRPGGEAVQRARQRAPHERGARLRVGGQAVQPRPHGRQRGGRAAAPPAAAISGTTSSSASSSPCSAEHLAQVVADLLDGPGRDPVQHERQRGAALAGGAQEVPGHRVGVAGRGGHEEPGVGRGQQLPRRAPGWPRRPSRCRARRAAPARRQRRSVGASRSEPGRRPGPRRCVRLSPGSTRSSSNQRRSSGWQTRTGARVVGRRTPDGLTTAPTRLLTSVDFPAPGRAADDHEQRRVQRAQPRQQVVVDLARELRAPARTDRARPGPGPGPPGTAPRAARRAAPRGRRGARRPSRGPSQARSFPQPGDGGHCGSARPGGCAGQAVAGSRSGRLVESARVQAAPYRVMGMVNVTPDSFSDGGAFLDAARGGRARRAARRARARRSSTSAASRRAPAPSRWPPRRSCGASCPVVEGLAAATAPRSSRSTRRRPRVAARGARRRRDLRQRRHRASRRPGDGRPGRRARRRRLPHAHARRAAHDAGATRATTTSSTTSRRSSTSAWPSPSPRASPRTASTLDPGIGFGKTLEHNLELLRAPRRDRRARAARSSSAPRASRSSAS